MWTLRELKDKEYRVTIYCAATLCYNSKELDLDKAAERLGWDHSGMNSDLLPKFRCSVCGSKQLTMTISPPTRNQSFG